MPIFAALGAECTVKIVALFLMRSFLRILLLVFPFNHSSQERKMNMNQVKY